MCLPRRTLIVLTFLFIPLIIISGCSGNSGYKPVDFSKPVKVSQPNSRPDERATLRVAVAAMIPPEETFTAYHELLDHIGKKLNYHVQMIQRKTYEEINEMFPKRQIDIAFFYTGPCAVKKKVYGYEVLATPVVRGTSFYHSYLIVNKDSAFQNFDNLRGYSFASIYLSKNLKAQIKQVLFSMHNDPEGRKMLDELALGVTDKILINDYGLRFLIMSDIVMVLNANEDECQDMSNLLKEQDYNPIVLHRLEGLKDRLQQTNCIVAILDLDSIHLNNRTIQELKRQFPKVYFLCTSKNRLHPELKDAIYNHIYACLNKPVDPDELFYWLKSIIKNETEFQSP